MKLLQSFQSWFKVKDYCTMFPEEVQNQEIGMSCCEQHDIDVVSTYSLVAPHTKFYKCLRSKNVTWTWASIITLGGAIGTYIKYPYFVYCVYRARRGDKV
jgi:hypothetical protein